MALFFHIFYSFFKIGLFGFGGGYAMISMINDEVVTKHHWLTSIEFTDIVAISQVTPGAIGINTSTYVGYSAVEAAGYPEYICIIGSLLATFAVVFPSFVLMIILSKFFLKHSEKPIIEDIFAVLRPTVIGLIAAASLTLMNTDNFGSIDNNLLQFCVSAVIFICAFVAVRVFKASPIAIVFVAGLAGLLIY